MLLVSVFALALASALPYPASNLTAPSDLILDENFSDETCALLQKQQGGEDWTLPTYQWGGNNVNGGVNAGNVNCRKGDPTYGNVLQLTTHGDRFTGAGPIGVDHDGKPVDASTGNSKWNFPGYQHKCAPHCNVQRVGASVRSKVAITAGVTEVVMKPCSQFGAASTIFPFSYQQEACGDPNKPNVRNQCSKDYTA